ncbi:hypothetical protein GGR57DRAFT_482467 [Xylariaceae sp. FL1272]|nr:hypothetical protein GGR57DRAFT_482467 [Xylariaceae sp. FL1272]
MQVSSLAFAILAGLLGSALACKCNSGLYDADDNAAWTEDCCKALDGSLSDGDCTSVSKELFEHCCDYQTSDC